VRDRPVRVRAAHQEAHHRRELHRR
jgi:hypothetical protein